MHDAMLALAEGADAIVMAAAVANYTPVSPAGQKIPHDSETMTVQLERTPDILGALASWRAARGGERPVLIGFAAETYDVVERARAKRLRKGIDLIVANDVSRGDAGFEVDTNAVTLIGEGPDQTVALASKAAVAGTILDRLARLLASVPTSVS